LSARRRERNQRNVAIVLKLKSEPCADCGQRYPPYVMDFDHVGPKTANISGLVFTVSTERLLREVAVCEVVCANCHRERTHSRSEARGDRSTLFG
jgi:hypothetical protein